MPTSETPHPIPAPVAALFPEPADRASVESWLSDRLAAVLPRVKAGRVVPDIDMEAFRARLAGYDFASALPLEQVLDWTLDVMEHGIVQMTNPRYFGLFNPNPSFPAQCADRVTNAFNPQLASSASSPVPVEIERHVIGAIAQRAGIRGSATGHFATGGSEANYTSLILALTAGHPRFAIDGARAYPGAPRFYTSRECHIAWLKIAHQAGVGRSALRLVETDGAGRMDCGALERAIREDRALGHVPVMAVATAGTTGAGMIDPLHACADIAQRESIWFHVDAAWGGAALASDHLRPLLAGIERADSITIDAHKWFATTMGCAMFITSRGGLLSEAFHAATSFMPSNVSALDPYLNSVQWSRRFLGLRLFVTLAAAGWQGVGRHVERSVAVVERIRGRLAAEGWSVVNESPMAVLDVIPPAGSEAVRGLVREVVAAGGAWVAPATFEGRDVIRICATNGETTEADVERLLAAFGVTA